MEDIPGPLFPSDDDHEDGSNSMERGDHRDGNDVDSDQNQNGAVGIRARDRLHQREQVGRAVRQAYRREALHFRRVEDKFGVQNFWVFNAREISVLQP